MMARDQIISRLVIGRKRCCDLFFEALPTHGSSRLLMYVELVNGGKKNVDE